jgi:hypothetical protein
MKPSIDTGASAGSKSEQGDMPDLASMTFTPLIDRELDAPQVPHPLDRDEAYERPRQRCALPNDLRRRNAALCSIGTCLSFLGFAIIFFVIPREPTALFSEFYYNSTAIPATSDDQLFSGKFLFNNHNFYDVSWTNLSTELFWLPTFNITNASIPEACSVSTASASQACGTDSLQLSAATKATSSCIVGLGSFTVALPAKTAWREEAELTVPLAQSTAQLACASDLIRLGLIADHAIFTHGRVNAHTALHDFGTLFVQDTQGFASIDSS